MIFRKRITSNKRLAMISLDWTRPKDPPLSLGHASILANLTKHNIDIIPKSWAVNDSKFQLDDVFEFLENSVLSKENFDVAIGAFVWNEKQVQDISAYLKSSKFSGNVIVGGPQVSYVKNGHDLEKYYPNADIFIKGYAEDALTSYMLSEEKYPTIQGIHYARKSYEKCISAVSDFEQLPSPYLTGIIQKQRFVRWETQRGCPFKCSFCQHRESDSNSIQKRKLLPYSRISQEIDWLVDGNIVQDIAVLDPTFNSGPNYLNILESFANRKYKGKLALQCRLEKVTPQFLERVQEVNTNGGRVVLEFGLQSIHKDEQKLIERGNNMSKVKSNLEMIQKMKIETEISLIFGLPGQSLDSFKESVAFCKTYEIPTIHAFPLMLLRGTPLYEKKDALKLVESSDVNFKNIPRIQTNIPHVISSPSFTYDDWLEMGEIAESLQLDNKI